MKKITGKALSLVLSLALVVSSFSVNLASASTKTVSGSVDLQQDDAKAIYLVSGGKDSGVDLTTWINNQSGGVTMDTPDHQTVTVDQITDVSHVSGDRLVKWGDQKGSAIDDNEDAYLFVKGSSSEGKEVIAVLYKGTYSDDDGNDVTVKAKANITVNVAKEGTVYVGKGYSSSDLAGRTGKAIEDISTLSQKTDHMLNATGIGDYVDSGTVGVYAVYDDAANSSCLATYQPVSVYFDKTNFANEDAVVNDVGAVTSADEGQFTVKASGSILSKVKLERASDSQIIIYACKDVGTGTITFTSTYTSSGNGKNITPLAGIGTNGNKFASDKETAKATVAKRVLVRDMSHNSIYKDKKTYINVDTAVNSDGKIDITGYDVKLSSAITSFSVGDKSSIGELKGTTSLTSLSFDTATVSDLVLDDNATTAVTLTDTKIGAVKAKDGSVSISGGTTGDVTADGSDGVTVLSGTVGDITSAHDVDIEATDDDTTTSVGTVKSDGTTTVDNQDSKIVLKGYTAKANSTLSLSGDSVTIGTIDMDYRTATLNVDDFQGKLPSPVNAKSATIQTSDEDDNVAFTGATTIDTLDMEDGSAVSFDNTLKANYVSGSGSLKLPVGDLYIVDGVSGSPVLKFSNDFKVGDTAFKADSDAVDEEDFTPFGFTLSKSEGSSVDTFKIATVAFAGLTIDPASSEVVLGAANAKTFTASAYPTGTTIPTGDKIAFDFDGNDNVFKVTDNGNGTATVEVLSVDSTFASENKGTLTAKLVDENGDDDTDYDSTDATLTAVTTPSVNYKSDTTGTVNMKVGGTYQFKITSLDGTVPNFVVAGNGGARVTGTSVSGKDYFYKVTAQKVGQYGVYVNGTTRTAILNITTNAKIDTTAVTIKLGNTYQFKVTSPVKPSFGLGSTSAITTSTSSSGTNYFYKVKAAGKVGDKVGVYVDGGLAAVITVG